MIRNLVINTLGFASVPALLHKLLKRRGISILAYHGVIDRPLPFDDWCFISDETFEQQIRYLSQNFEIISLSEAVSRLDAGQVDRPTAVITFDDGYRNNYDIAFPILKKYNAPATIYLVSDQMGSTDTLWFCRLNQALANTSLTEISWNGMQLDLSTPAAKSSASAQLQGSLKGMENSRLLEQTRALVTELGGDPDAPIQEESPYRLLNQQEIDEMRDSGLIEFGAHTCSHAILSRLSASRQAEEIGGSKTAVEALTGQTCDHFAYPNGSLQDHDAHTAELLREAGYASCVNMRPGANFADTDRMHLHRYGIGTDTSFNRFKLWVHHIR